jgi:hypothetical protein
MIKFKLRVSSKHPQTSLLRIEGFQQTPTDIPAENCEDFASLAWRVLVNEVLGYVSYGIWILKFCSTNRDDGFLAWRVS